MSKNLTSQRKDSEKASDINVQFMSLDVKLILKRKKKDIVKLKL